MFIVFLVQSDSHACSPGYWSWAPNTTDALKHIGRSSVLCSLCIRHYLCKFFLI